MTAAAITLLAEAIQPRSGRGGWHGGPTPLGGRVDLSSFFPFGDA